LASDDEWLEQGRTKAYMTNALIVNPPASSSDYAARGSAVSRRHSPAFTERKRQTKIDSGMSDSDAIEVID
jgi:hypothetical protein